MEVLVAEKVLANQQRVTLLAGENHDGALDSLPLWPREPEQASEHATAWRVGSERLTLRPPHHDRSYVVSGLVGGLVWFQGKVNHLVVRRCRDVTIVLKHGAISGFDVLECQRVRVCAPRLVSANLEYASDIYLGGASGPETTLTLLYALYVSVEGRVLPGTFAARTVKGHLKG